MSHMLELTAPDGFKFPAYVAEPAQNPKGGWCCCKRFLV